MVEVARSVDGNYREEARTDKGKDDTMKRVANDRLEWERIGKVNT